MSFLNKTIGFMAVFAVAPSVFGLTARPSIVGAASSRMPTMSTYITSSNTSTSTTTSSLLANAECIDAYTSCMKGGDACGSNFEECTTKVLFHGKMPQCLSTLAQCSGAGVSSLFGTSTVTALSNVATKNSYGEVTDYTYPTDGSVLGQLIIGAAISNKYDTSNCVKRYTSCLRKDSVCGADFELCTTDKEFRKQRVFCDSTLARCQSDGVIELFGSNNTNTTPAASSRIGEMITEGAALAAVNAVSTCYKVVDQCILNACATNPYKCYENSAQSVVNIVEAINNNEAVAGDANAVATDTISRAGISAYIRNSCLDTIGSNKYCYATFLGNGAMPTSSQLRDEDNQEEIYDEAYNARMNSGMKAKIADLVDKFDTKAKQKCTETIKACAMRTCGSGSGAACYSQVFGSRDKSINAPATYNEIKTGCASIVNTDAYCKYAAANPDATGPYNYAYINNDAFDTLFPEFDDGAENDPIGVVASLNAALANNYSDAAIANMKRQCQAVASGCVKNLCGADYVNCYRNRTDIYSSLTNTGDASFDKSMNKVGGVLDYTIVLGLCLDTVKNASVCEEHLAIERNKLKMANNASASSWGSANTVRDGWFDAGSASKVTATTEQVQDIDANGNLLCTAESGGFDTGRCNVDMCGTELCTKPAYISYTTYVESQAASSLFKDLVYDLEKEAQAKYNAKLTREQNACMAGNAGGVMGNRDQGSTFMWVKLKSNKVPKNYSVNGLKSTQFTASNDLYGSFCRVRVTIQSDDKRIQEVLREGKDWATAYFATGDTFTCGSWIPASALESIANAVADEAVADKRESQQTTRNWLTALGAIGGGVGGAYLGNGIQNGSVFGKLTGLNSNAKNETSFETLKQNCTYIAGQIYDENSYNSNYVYLKDMATKVNEKSLADMSGRINALKAIDGTTVKYTDGENGMDKAVAALSASCQSAVEKDAQSANAEKNNQWIGTAIGTVVGGVGGGIMLNKLTGDIQKSSLNADQRAAYEAWMNSVGNHITCYVGGDEAGSYGDIINVTVD